MKNRIFEFMRSVGLTSTEFADQIGVSRAQISSIKTGRTQPTLVLVEKIKAKFPNINVNWLIFGDGECCKDLSVNHDDVSNANLNVSEKYNYDTEGSDRNLFSIPDKKECESNTSQVNDQIPSSGVSIAEEDHFLRVANSNDSSNDSASAKYKSTQGNFERKAVFDDVSKNIYNVKEQTDMKMLSQRKIKKIVLLYDDGSFEEFER